MLDHRPPRAPHPPAPSRGEREWVPLRRVLVDPPPAAPPPRPRPPAPPPSKRPSGLQRDLARLRRTLRRLHGRWGWRLFAVPVLLVVTVAALVTGGSDDDAAPTPVAAAPGASSPAPVASDQQLKDDPAAGADQREVLASDALPAGGPFTMQGSGTYHVVPGSGPAAGAGPLFLYTVEVEDGITGVDEGQFGKVVQQTLQDRRSWVGRGDVALRRVDSGPVSWRVTLATPLTVRALCGYEIPVETSCWDPTNGRVVLNLARWVRGSAAYVGDVDTYRVYLVNHENGHALGHEHVTECLANGYAPIMMQQTLSVNASNGAICQPNPWPNVAGVAPGPDPRGVSADPLG